ncbi:MAG: 50S ribosomal protein L11 methyltransferase [Campylobacterales bacterium]|nr:50S ribosomal protein L11 methyltransferase [Campylobacterales bacterium]
MENNSTYNELTITLPSVMVEFVADYVANIFNDAIEMGHSEIIIRSQNDIAYVKESVEALIAQLDSTMKMEFKMETKTNEDWISTYQNSIEPIEVGSFYIYPSWYEGMDGKINIKIDPALAFGSGHHATTSSCLEFISKYTQEGNQVLDVGCGSGILALGASKLGAIVDLCDTDPLSVESAKENFALNNAVYNNIWEGSANKAQSEYNIVIANIIADVLKLISSDIKKATRKGGIMLLSGILDKKETIVSKAFADMNLIDRKLQDEWVTLVYEKI